MKRVWQKVKTPLRLLLFAIFTSIGYLLYGVFLKQINYAILTFNTFFWLFVLQCFRLERGRIQLRSPTESIHLVISSHLAGAALAIFGYWYLFWYSASLVANEDSSNFSVMALSLLSINTVAYPLAVYFAKRDHLKNQNPKEYLIVGAFLVLSVILTDSDIDFDAGAIIDMFGNNAQEYHSKIHIIIVEIGKLVESPALPAAGCILLAVLAEATGDYLITKRVGIRQTSMMNFSEDLDATVFGFEQTSRFINEVDIIELLSAVISECRESRRSLVDKQLVMEYEIRMLSENSDDFESEEAEVRKIRLSEAISDYGQEIDILANRLSNVEDLMEKWNSYEEKLSKDKKEKIKLEREIRKEIIMEYWHEVYTRKFENMPEAKRVELQKKFREDVVDVASIIGLCLSFLLVFPHIGEVFKLEEREFWWFLGVLSVLGLTGSVARPLFLLPIAMKSEASEAIIPPIYAVRSLIFFAVGWFLLRYCRLDQWTKNSAPIKVDVEHVVPHGHASYIVGSAIAIVCAVWAWRKAYLGGRKVSAAQ